MNMHYAIQQQHHSVVWQVCNRYSGMTLKGVLRSKKWISQNYTRRV